MTLDSKPDVLHVLNDQVAAYTCPDLQNTSNDSQKRHGGLTTVNHLLHSEYKSPFDQQPKNSSWITVALSPHQSRTFMPVHPRPPLPASSNIRSQRTIPVVPIRAPFSRSAPHSWKHPHIPNRRSSKAPQDRLPSRATGLPRRRFFVREPFSRVGWRGCDRATRKRNRLAAVHELTPQLRA